MTITEPALKSLRNLARRAGGNCQGFRFEGVVGSCRASVPILKPAEVCGKGEIEVQAGEIRIFIPLEHQEMMEAATLDYDTSLLFGRGLNLTWPHGVRGCPACG